MRHHHTVFHRDCTNLHSHQQCTGVPFALHLCQHLLSVVLLIAILTGVTWYPIVVLIFMSPAINGASWVAQLVKYSWASLVAQTVKNLPAMLETWVQSLGCEDPLEEGMATHSSILAWRIPRQDRGTEEPGGLQSMGSQIVEHDRATKHSPAWLMMLSVFSCAICISSLEKCLFRSSTYFLIRLFGFIWRRVVWALYIFWMLIPYQVYHL